MIILATVMPSFFIMLKGKKILLGVTGSIAAYKSAVLVRLLIKSGAEVKVVMTKAAEDFIPALTLSTLSKNKTLRDLFEEDTWANHVMLGRWADIFIIAPASCNTIAKMAGGICDNLLQAVYLSATCPVMIAPAMDEDMWKHPSCRHNIETLKQFGNIILPPNDGELASGLTGEGRMAEPEDIITIAEKHFQKKNDLSGKRILITAGPTYEAIDPVRFIGNYSSGKMGIALAKECIDRGGDVKTILGPSSEKISSAMKVQRVQTAAEMYEACIKEFEHADIAIMCAAVADYAPVAAASQKIKKQDGVLNIELKPTADILKKLGELKSAGQLLVGFALETENEKVNALHKLAAKNADYIILNSLKDAGAGFGGNTNKITIFDREGIETSFETKTKAEAAADIIEIVLKKQYA